ncbi:hypothetical protein HMPREF0569_0074 [Micrococcus luteus SK58]|nr:hypothetical protein HMPREF0569_0074 [Micrococcus luteus SK58]
MTRHHREDHRTGPTGRGPRHVDVRPRELLACPVGFGQRDSGVRTVAEVS